MQCAVVGYRRCAEAMQHIILALLNNRLPKIPYLKVYPPSSKDTAIHMPPHRRSADGLLSCSLLRSDKYEHNLSSLLLALACSHGKISIETVEYLFKGVNLHILVRTKLMSRPVFLIFTGG